MTIPPWWMGLLAAEFLRYRKRLEREDRFSFQRLADDLTEAYGRELNGEMFAWDRKTVERFLDGDSPTSELAEAFRLLMPDLPRFTFTARSLLEADAIEKARRRFNDADSTPEPLESNPEKNRRNSELVQLRAATEQRASDQTDRIDSKDEVQRRSGSRRPRGVG